MTGSGGQPVTVDRGGRPLRHFPVVVSASSMALAWARQESAPHLATILADQEINALGRLGEPWLHPAATTLTCAVVLRPTLDAEDADVPWLLGGLGVAEGIEAVTGSAPATWWPDAVIDGEDDHQVASVLCEAQLAPGRVRAAVVTLRIDLAALGIETGRRDELLDAVLESVDQACNRLAEDPASAATAYQNRCALMGRRLKVRLRPHGETRGTVAGVDVRGRLQLQSGTGMVERVTVDMLRDLEVV